MSPRDVIPMFPQASSGGGEPANLESLLVAFNSVSQRLQLTQRNLASEVHRLNVELEIKNRELARKNRLADLGQIASHIAHEVRNNLVPVSLYVSLLRRRLADDRGSLDVVEKVESGLLALDAMVNDLLNFTSDRDPLCRPFRLNDLIHDVLAALEPQLEAQGVLAEVDIPPPTTVWADRDMLRRAVLNLVFNALDAMPEGGSLVVTGYESPDSIELEVADSGPGLSDDARRRAFEPFFTTKRNGIGLGLAIVYRMIDAHGGKITATNCPEGGAAFTIRLPRRQLKEAAA